MTPGNGALPSFETTIRCTTLVQNQRGLHARAAAKFVKISSSFDAEVQVTKGGQTVSGKSILGLMMLAAGPGTEITLEATGPQAEEAVRALCGIIDAKFNED